MERLTMQATDIIYSFPVCMDLLQRTVALLNDPDADWTQAHRLQYDIREMLNKFEPKKEQ